MFLFGGGVIFGSLRYYSDLVVISCFSCLVLKVTPFGSQGIIFSSKTLITISCNYDKHLTSVLSLQPLLMKVFIIPKNTFIKYLIILSNV